MPLTPNNPNVNSNNVENRRAASPKRDTDVLASKHPVVTKAVYDAVIRGDGKDQNLKIKRLCQTRNTLGKLLILLDGSMKDHNPQLNNQPSATWNALRQIHREAERSYLKFPLNIQNK